MSFNKLGLSDPVMRGVDAAGYDTPTEIQAGAIPPALSGREVIGRAETGSGKTAAFVLPILDKLSMRRRRARRAVRALVLTPTRELAHQIDVSANRYGRYARLRAYSIYGGVSIDPQLKRLNGGIDLLVATPGRLLDHIDRKSIDLSQCEFLVVDEADRMFDMGFIKDVKKIIGRIPAARQTMLFSATMTKEVRRLTAGIMDDPVVVEIGQESNPAESVRQHFFSIRKDRKMDLLFHMLEKEDLSSVLVFSRTKHGADKISKKLEREGVRSTALHSNRSQSQRQKALDGFKRGQFRVLVATDIAARGIDVRGISHVINYDTPSFPEDYIHRIGRTGRASAKGDAITFVSNEEFGYLRKIESLVGKRYEVQHCKGLGKESAADLTGPAPFVRVDERPRRPSNGFRRPTDGSPRSKDGSRRPKDGSRRTTNGSGHSSDRSQRSTNGSGDGSWRSKDGSRRTANGSGRSADGSWRSKDGTRRPANGSGHSSDGSRRPSNGEGFESSPPRGKKKRPINDRGFEASPSYGNKRKPSNGKKFQRKAGNNRPVGKKSARSSSSRSGF